MYGGAVVRTLAGSQLNETNLVSAALNMPAGTDEAALAAQARKVALAAQAREMAQ
jgi:hypothetical protein